MHDDFPESIPDSNVQRLQAEALGEPGQRRFRLVVVVAGETHIIWMEKQQMQALGLAIGQILEQVAGSGLELDTGAVPGAIDDATTSQFRLGRVELGFDETGNSILINAFDVQDEDEVPNLSMRLTRSQARALVRDAAVLAAAGRPICPMCGQSMDAEGHVCPEQNGHLPLPNDDTLLNGD
jgi:uncharacterized repeat protein (TIGR03847 family)